jgi:LmbE family N-acetylglucosaminyl deacetylase
MTGDPRQAVVFVTAHPDDVAFFMGGTALLLKERYDLHVICATRGERGHGAPSEEVARTREAEEREACAMLGASITFLGLSDGEIFAERPVVERVADMLRTIRPVAVFTHGPQAKPDHAAVYIIALQALYVAELFWEVEMYMPLQDGETRHGRYADLYVNVSSVIEAKRALVACHRSHHREAGSVESIIAHDALLGRLAWCDYAEAYMTGLPLMGERWNRKAGSILLG